MLRTIKYPFVLVIILVLFIIPTLAATVVVSPSQLNGWGTATETGDAPPAEFVFGPANAPMGVGSANFVLNDGADGVALGTALQGVRIDSLTTLSYSTYVAQYGGFQTLALQFNIDFDLTDNIGTWQGRMVYEPYYTETVVTGQWQTWDALAGKWWFTGAPGNSVCPMSAPCDLATILATYPNIGVQANQLGAVLFKAGSGWGNFDGNVDAFTIGINGVNTTYNFEPDSTSCFNGGWEDAGFRNQGQCISAINSNRGGN